MSPVSWAVVAAKAQMKRSDLRIGRKVDNPVWLAPEIIKGKEYTEKADVYAYGVILYEILTLKPFLSEYRFFSEMEDSIVAGKRPELPSDGNPRLLSLIEDCWATDASARPTFDEGVQLLVPRHSFPRR